MHTIATAAAAVGRNKIAILRAIKAGKISVVKDENGEWRVADRPRRTAPHLSPIAERIHAGQRYAAAPASVAVANASLRITACAPTPAHSDDSDQAFQRIATSVTRVRDGAVGCCF